MEDDNILISDQKELIPYIEQCDGGDSFEKRIRCSSYRKVLSNRWDAIVNWSMDLGNQHFSITINMPTDEIHPFYYEDIDTEWYSEIESGIANKIIGHFPTITYLFIISEKNKRGVIHFHCLLAIRNFIDYSYILKHKIGFVLKGHLIFETGLDDSDVKVETLCYFRDVKNWAIYLYKDMHDWKLYGVLYVLEKYKCYPFVEALEIHSHFYLAINFLIKEIIPYPEMEAVKEMTGIKITKNEINQRTLVNLLQYYLTLNHYFIHKDSVYKKIDNSKISYFLVGTITYVLYDMFQENVVTYYSINYPNYFSGFDFNYLLTTFFMKSKMIIEGIRDISTQRIEPDFSLIEFTDGVYSIKYDRFFRKCKNYEFHHSIATFKYYNKSYEGTRKHKPINWINGLKNALNIKDNELANEDFITICLCIINAIHKNIFDKKSALFIYGKSNTGKTALIVDILCDFFGKENIGFIINAKNFKWQALEEKFVAIIDEGRYTSSMSSDFLKIMGGENILVEKKYSKNHIHIINMKMFILTNIMFSDDNKEIENALKNRMYIIEFLNAIDPCNLKNTKVFKESLKEEESNIIIYCNKLFFNKSKKTLNTKISNDKLLKQINVI